MKKRYYSVLIFVIAIGGGYLGYEYLTGNGNDDNQEDNLTSLYQDTLNICSFNIQFLGHFKKKKDSSLASILKDYDIVIIQELVAPPIDGIYPDGESYSADKEAKSFLDEMSEVGFDYLLSEEDTGPGDENHKITSATEWWIAFYKPWRVMGTQVIPHGFLAADRSNHPDYDRVPYAFAFQSPDNCLDFVLISVHLAPGKSASSRRGQELLSINNWVKTNDSMEKDFIILGDMNIEDSIELSKVTPSGFLSLNNECRRTNTLINLDRPNNGAKPYDHVMYRPEYSGHEIDINYDFQVVDLIEAMRNFWDSQDLYPGDPYNHNLFKQYYSDHHPVVFRLLVTTHDDD